MPAKKAAKKTVRKTAKQTQAKKKAPAAAKSPVQEALRITWRLKGDIKRIQLQYIRAGVLLADVRDRKLYAELKHPDMESYAEARLDLGRSSLYMYLKVHDWICRRHKEWLEPKPKGFIPQLTDANDLMWIEDELDRKDLKPETRAELEALQKKAMEGKLRQRDLSKFRRHPGGIASGLKSFLSKLRFLRMRGDALASMPPEVITHLDTAIEILKNDHELQTGR